MRRPAPALALLASLVLFAGWTQTSQSDWFKGIIYAGSGKVQLTDSTGNLVGGGSGSFVGNVAIGGTLAVTGATTLRSTLAVTGNESVTGTLAVTGATTLRSTLATTGASTLTGIVTTGSDLSVGGSGSVAGNLAITGNETVAGNETVTGTLAVTGATSLKSTLAVVGNTTLTGTLAVTGASTFIGAVTMTAPTLVSVSAAFSAGGSSKTDATALTAEYSTITGTALQGVSLLAAAVGLHQVVYNNSAVTLIVYPLDASNDTLAVNDLAALSADTGIGIGPLGVLDCTAFTTTAWHCVYLPGSRSTVAAAGTNQGTCTQLASATMGSNVAVTAADATKAVCLPTGGSASTYIPACITIQSTVNTNTAYLPVFGSATDDDTINGAAADAVYTMGAGARVMFCTIDGVAWLTR